MENSFSFLAYAGAWVTVSAGVWALFDRIERTATKEAKAKTSHRLKGLKASSIVERWPGQVGEAFDYVFGRRHLSVACFWRSSIASIASVVAMLMLATAIDPRILTFLADLLQRANNPGYLVVFLMATVANLLPDYLSLLQTRLVLRHMRSTRTSRGVLGLIVMDLVFTTAIAVIGVGVLRTLLVWRIVEATDLPFSLRDALGHFRSSFALDRLPSRLGLVASSGGNLSVPTLAPWLYATYVTSIWVWLYALAGLALRTAQRLDPVGRRIAAVLDVEDKPFNSMGLAAVLIATAAFLIGLPFLW